MPFVQFRTRLESDLADALARTLRRAGVLRSTSTPLVGDLLFLASRYVATKPNDYLSPSNLLLDDDIPF